MSVPSFDTLKLDLATNGVLTVIFSRPGGNAMNAQLFQDWHEALKFAEASPAVKVLVQTGEGKFYSSGKDLSPTMDSSFEVVMNREMDTLEALINTCINFPKPMVAAVNGPAIGFGVTSLAHFDFIYAVPNATYTVPFMRWGFCAEGCSSILFPRMLGKHLANELLLAGATVDSERLQAAGFLQILDSHEFLKSVQQKAALLAQFDPHTVSVTRDLIARNDRAELMAVNHDELSQLRTMMMREDSRRAIQDFVDQRAAKKLKKQSTARL